MKVTPLFCLLALTTSCAVASPNGPCNQGFPDCHAVMLSNLGADCAQSGGVITCPRASGAANVIYASAATAASFTRLDEYTIVFEGTSFTSQRGLSPITLTTSNVTVTATYGTSGYALAGLLVPPFTGAETMTVSAPGAMPAVTPIVLTAPASPPTFGALDGWSTEVLVPDGSFDSLFVYAHDDAGTSGVLHQVPASAMTLRGSDRVAPILPDNVLAELETRGIDIARAIVGPYRRVQTTALFPGLDPVPVQAGSLVDLPLAAVTP